MYNSNNREFCEDFHRHRELNTSYLEEKQLFKAFFAINRIFFFGTDIPLDEMFNKLKLQYIFFRFKTITSKNTHLNG